MLKVAHLATSLHGGAGIAAFRIHQSLVNAGVDSTLYTFSAPEEMINSVGVNVLKRNAMEKNLSKAVTATQKFFVQKNQQLFTPISIHSKEISRFYDYDLIHLHNIYNLTNLKQVSHLFMKVPIVLTLHDMRNFTGGCHHSCGCQKFIESSCAKCPQARIGFQTLVKKKSEVQIQHSKTLSNLSIAAPSKWILELVQESSMWGDRPARLIHNPIPEVPNLKVSEKKDMINRIGFISPNLHNPFKGFDILTKALVSLPESWWNSNKVILVGEGELTNLLPSSRIEQVPSKSPQELMSLYRELDFLVIPSTQDNFPNVIGEATVHGVNLILSDVGGLPEAAEIFGFQMFESGNPESLARCLQNLQKIEPQSLIKKAENVFSYKRAAHGYQALYGSMTS
jgi:glycosyltransferase involved in cell wall biosynthesis